MLSVLCRGVLNLGIRQGGDMVSDVKLPPWYDVKFLIYRLHLLFVIYRSDVYGSLIIHHCLIPMIVSFLDSICTF